MCTLPPLQPTDLPVHRAGLHHVVVEGEVAEAERHQLGQRRHHALGALRPQQLGRRLQPLRERGCGGGEENGVRWGMSMRIQVRH